MSLSQISLRFECSLVGKLEVHGCQDTDQLLQLSSEARVWSLPHCTPDPVCMAYESALPILNMVCIRI